MDTLVLFGGANLATANLHGVHKDRIALRQVCSDFWLVISEGPPFVDGHGRVPLRWHKCGDIQKNYCSLQRATVLPFAR